MKHRFDELLHSVLSFCHCVYPNIQSFQCSTDLPNNFKGLLVESDCDDKRQRKLQVCIYTLTMPLITKTHDAFVLILFPLWPFSCDPRKTDWALIFCFLQFHTVKTRSRLGAAGCNNRPLWLPEVKSLASVYLSALLSLSPCKAETWRHVSFNGLVYTQGAVGWVRETDRGKLTACGE